MQNEVGSNISLQTGLCLMCTNILVLHYAQVCFPPLGK